MRDFEKVTAEEFGRCLSAASCSEQFKKQFMRLDPTTYDGWNGPSYVVYQGDLAVDGNWKAPGFQTLVIGNLSVRGLVDLSNPYDQGFDEGGLFIVLGNVECKAFSNEYGKASIVDGNLYARDILINDFGDSSLYVTVDLKTKYLHGVDMWVSVGGAVDVDYGDGYCCRFDEEGKIHPRHGIDESRRVLNPEIGSDGLELREILLRGENIFVRDFN